MHKNDVVCGNKPDSTFDVVAVISNPPAPSGRKMILSVSYRLHLYAEKIVRLPG